MNKVTVNLDAVDAATRDAIIRLRRDGWPKTWNQSLSWTTDGPVAQWEAKKDACWAKAYESLRAAILLFTLNENMPVDTAVDRFFGEWVPPDDSLESTSHWRWHFFKAQEEAMYALIQPEPNGFEVNGITPEEITLYRKEFWQAMKDIVAKKRAERNPQ